MEEPSPKMTLEFLDEILSRGKNWILKEKNLLKIQTSFASLPNAEQVPLEVHEKICLALTTCLDVESNIWRFAKHYLVPEHPPFKRFIEESLEPPPSKKNKSEVKTFSDETILKCCLSFLNCDSFFQILWPWDRLLSVAPSLSNESKWLAVECLGRLANWSETKREQVFRNLLSGESNFDALALNHFLEKSSSEQTVFVTTDFSCGDGVSRTVCIHGRHLMKDAEPNDLLEIDDSLKFVNVKSREPELIKMVEAIGANKPIMLEGPMGCGKTKLVEHVAMLAGRKEFERFHRVYMSDRTDGRSLVGGYTCHDVPGNFNWEDGVLTRAVKAGDWLLIEDVHLAPSDVMSTLLPLIERGQLHVPTRGVVIKASPGFQLFLTQRIDASRLSSVKGTCHINVGDFGDDELNDICVQLFPPLEHIATKMVACFVALRTRQNAADASARKRLFSIRDLKKWCRRCSQLPSIDNETIVLEGFDCFCNHISSAGHIKMDLVRGIGQMFNLTRDNIDHLALERFPGVNKTRDAIKVGRTTIPRKVVAENKNRRPFYLTRQASRLLEFLSTAIGNREPILLVGETGVGKTSAVQYLCDLLGKKLVTVNLNQQTESADLLGGFKPVDFEHFVLPVRKQFESLFRRTFSSKENAKFMTHLSECQARKRWSDLVQLMVHACKGGLKKDILTKEWKDLEQQLDQLKKSVNTQAKLLFSFVNGALTDAVQKGEWILLDEINMADTEVLECLSEVMNPEINNLCLYGGNEKLIQKHPDFRVFACMNPATDVGKKELPDGLRNRFTEYFIEEPTNEQDLLLIVQDYLKNLAPTLDLKVFKQVVKFFFSVKQLADRKLLDGTGHKPTYSLRTLCRALDIASQNFCQNPKRSLLEAFLMCFLTELDRSSYPVVFGLVLKHFGKGEAVTTLKTPIAKPPSGLFVNTEGYWLSAGEKAPAIHEDFILTESVRQNLKDVARIVSLSRFAVLLQGETSVGKTSLITYLSKATGNMCLRINNHEHTDIQEYVGAYCMDHHGNFTFQEGVLARAMRLGYWIILDELNLAPSDVLEALNRVLDDNRELFVPETQTLIKAHPSFRIFATQNPSGSSYGGRKTLSRAFRNRFVELHFSELPSTELAFIIEKRCKISAKASKKLISVMHDLQMARKSSAALEGKRGYLTLRDLFRWADRCSMAEQPTQFYDWERHFAEEGFLVLASKVRLQSEVEIVQKCLEKIFARKINPEELYDLSKQNNSVTRNDVLAILDATSNEDIVWTRAAVRMAVITLHSLRFKEPVLLVGETGCGKTQICQTLARVLERALVSINCHLNTESSDFLGGLRPNRGITEGDESLFQWVDGPLVQAMTHGSVLLVDEISLADDSVLERMNSILEPERTLFLIEETSSAEFREIVAHENFQFVATMNPGGDFGKKELSPALRNRLVEIWCPADASKEDLLMITTSKIDQVVGSEAVQSIIDFVIWYRASRIGSKVPFTLRDLLGWICFINKTHAYLGVECSLVHGICLVIFDGLGSFLTGESLADMKEAGRKFFKSTFLKHSCECFDWITSSGNCSVLNTSQCFQIGPFSLEKRAGENSKLSFHFGAPTVSKNTLKILRALQIENKAVLLEGLPGVGKSSLIEALAKMTGNSLVRINLSDQTEISDLFGADLPTESGSSIASFSWHDGPFLSALRSGSWILLDELNLATQSVLEGLNACLDHRGKIYIPELNRSFEISQNNTRIFGCQNPPREGGDRKNLPKSFLNRFVKVFLTEFDQNDLALICRHQHPSLSHETVAKLVKFAVELHRETCIEKSWGYSGSPWQFNLRDLLRWCQAVSAESHLAFRYAELIFIERFRMPSDRDSAGFCLSRIIQDKSNVSGADTFYINKNVLQIGSAILQRSNQSLPSLQRYRLLHSQYEVLESLMLCVKNNWLSILVGQSDVGKSSLVNILADLVGHPLHAITLTSASDTSELLGGFEQTGPFEKMSSLAHELVEQVSRDLEREQENRQATTKLVQLQMRLNRIKDDKLDLGELETIVDEYQSIVKTSDWKSRLVSLKETGKIGFEWMDSVLIRAVKNGDWLLLDDANLCNSAVLDRLNSLLEPNGVLVVGERGCSDQDGTVPTVVPHPNFRLFLTVNPLHGELSPAIRNRGVEIFLDRTDRQIDPKAIQDECLIRDLSTYSSASLLLQQNKLLQDLCHTKGMHPSVGAKALLIFASLEDLSLRETVFSRQFLLKRPELFDNVRSLLTQLEANNPGEDVRSSSQVVSFVEAAFAIEMIQQKPASNSAGQSLNVKQLWSSLVSFATSLFNHVKATTMRFEQPSANDVLSVIIISNLFQTMKSKLDNETADNLIMKQWSLCWLRLQNFLSETPATDFVSSSFMKNETEISSCVQPYFSAFNLSVRDFWTSIGLPLLSKESIPVLEERKHFLNLSLKFSLTQKIDLPSICDHVTKMSKSFENFDSIALLCQNFSESEIAFLVSEEATVAAPKDVLKLQLALVAAWNAYLKNNSVLLGISQGTELYSSVLFPLETINWLRTANKTDKWSTETAFEFQALSVQQKIVIQHIFSQILAGKPVVESTTEILDKKEVQIDFELKSVSQLMRQVAMGKRDFLDVEISLINERRQQMLALQSQLVADCGEVVKFELSAEESRNKLSLENFGTILHGIDSLELPIISSQIEKEATNLSNYAKSLKTKVQSSTFFPKHLQDKVVEILSVALQEFEKKTSSNDYSMLQLCTGLLLLHVSSELGFVDISEHLTATAEAIESEITSMTWVMIAEDTCNVLTKVDEPFPVRPSQSQRRQLMGNHVTKQVAAWQKAVENIPKRHPTESFDALAQELDQLQKSLFSLETVLGLAKSLKKNSGAESCLERLESWNLSVVKVMSDFKAKFSSFQDITVPVLAGVTDIVSGMLALKTRQLDFTPIESHDRLRYLLLEIDSLPEKNLDVILARGNLDLVTSTDVLRDLGASWLNQQTISAEDNEETNKNAKSVVFKFRDGEDPEETAELLEDENKFTESGTEKQLLRSLFKALEKNQVNSSSSEHFKDTYFELMDLVSTGAVLTTSDEKTKLYRVHCQAISASLTSKSCETEKLRPLMDEMQSFIAKNVTPYNEEHPVLESINRMIGDILCRSQLEPAKTFLIPLETLIQTLLEWNKHVPRNQIIPYREVSRLVINWRKNDLTWQCIRDDINDHMSLAIYDCMLALWPIIQDAIVGKGKPSKKSICAPFVLFFTSAFAGDFGERIRVIQQLRDVFCGTNVQVAKLLNAIIVYFKHFGAAMEKKIGDKLKKMKQKFEVFRKAGKLFEEEKMRLHFKETTKVRRDTTLQILTALKEPAMRYANRQPSAIVPVSPSEDGITLFSDLSIENGSDDVMFVSEKGTQLGGIKELKEKSRGLLRHMDSIFTKKADITEELDCKKEQLENLWTNLKRPASGDKKMSFHPTQKVITNMLADLRELGLRPLYGARFDLRTIHLLSEIQVPLAIDDALVEELTYFMFRYEELKESFYCPEKCVKGFASCQKGYDQLTHGMLQVIKLQRSLVQTKENMAEIKSVAKNFATSWQHQLKNWTMHCDASLKKLNDFCDRISSILGNVHEADGRNCWDSNFDLAALKKDAGKVRVLLDEYSKLVENLKAVVTNETNLAETQTELIKESVEKMEKIFKEMSTHHPNVTGGILSPIVSLHTNAMSNIAQMQEWQKQVLSTKKPLPEHLVSQFEINLKSASTQCLVALQETSKIVKKLQIVGDEDDSGFLITTYDRAVAGLKSLRVGSVLSDFQALSCYINLCEQKNYSVQPLLDQAKTFAPLFEVYLDYVDKMSRHSERIGIVSCRYLSQCAYVLRAFLLYDFGKIEQEESKEGEETKDLQGTGLGDGQADKATTDDLESEDVFDGAEKPKKPEDEEEEEQDEKTQEEDGVEMSGDLDSQMQEKEDQEEDEKDESDKEDEDEEMLDKEEGETDPDKGLDEQVWNDEEQEEPEEQKEQEKEMNKENRENESKEKKNDPRGETNPQDEEEEDKQKPKEVEDEEKRERKEDEGAEEENAEELEMKDALFGDEEMEPPEPEDLEMGDDVNMDEEEGDGEEEEMEPELPVEKLPDFADDKKEEKDEEEKANSDVEQEGEEPAGHDRQDTNQAEECKSKPMTTEQEDEKPNEQNEDKGTEFDGLQDENGEGDSNTIDKLPEEQEQKEPEEEMVGDVEQDKVAEKEEEKLLEPEMASKVDKKTLTEETPHDDDVQDQGKMEQLFAHTRDVEKCTDKTVDRANEDEMDDNMDVDEQEDQDEKEKKTENLTNNVRKLEKLELVETEIVERSDETILSKNENFMNGMRGGDSSNVEILTHFRAEVTSNELKEWLELCGSVHDLSQTLTEQLRLILEPTKATKFRGDFKSGKKLNMRKIIPFIASNYRKDKIWLRRTKPSKRDYLVMVAVDDSSSMNVNEVRRTAYQSLATLCGALSTLEVGKFGLLSFGNEPKLVHPLQANFSHEDGAHLLKTLTFEQTATNIAKMLDMAHKTFANAGRHTDVAKLLLILSDGRGIFNEGQDRVLEAVRNVLLADTFVIFVIVENIGNKDSVLDMRIATFDDNNKPTIVSYMDQFPFPYYMILKNVNALPQSLSDALRQWFALVAN